MILSNNFYTENNRIKHKTHKYLKKENETAQKKAGERKSKSHTKHNQNYIAIKGDNPKHTQKNHKQTKISKTKIYNITKKEKKTKIKQK